MRVTNSLFYHNSKNQHQTSLQSLYKINAQLSSGMKIQNSFEDSGVFVDTMRLDYEVAALSQVKETSSKAQTFANNTDKTLNQFNDALIQFKTKMNQAASNAHSSTSLNAIADELQALKEHMISLGNTSINGQFLFSGSALSIKPIDSDGSYKGNEEKLQATIGSNVKLPYNIDGSFLFNGVDNDYHRVVSTNVPMYNQSKLHPDIMVLNSGVTEPKKVYLTANDTIRDMVGDTDNKTTDPNDLGTPLDPSAVFHISGKRPDGTTFTSAVQMQSHEKVSELLEKIGNEFGNTPTNQVVDVSMNDYGQIEIKDLSVGNQQLQFHIVGAVDRENAQPGTAGNALRINDNSGVHDLSNIQIIEFQKSDYPPTGSKSKITTSQNIFNPGEFTLGAPMYQSNGNPVTESTKLRDFMGDELNQITLSGLDNSGNTVKPLPPLDQLQVNSDTTVQNLLSSIESVFGVSARLENGQIYVQSSTVRDFENNELKINLEAEKFSGDGEIHSFEITNGSDATLGQQIELTLSDGVTTHNVNIPSNATSEDIAKAIAADEKAIKIADPNVKGVFVVGNKVVFDYKDSSGNLAADVTVTSLPSTVTESGTTKEQIAVIKGLAEVQAFQIKEDPSVDGSIRIHNILGGSDYVLNYGPSTAFTTKEQIANEIRTSMAIPFTDSNGNVIVDVTASNGKVEFTYEQTDPNVEPLEITISQATVGVDDLRITPQEYRTITESSRAQPINAFTSSEAVSFNNLSFLKDGNKVSSTISQITKASDEYATASTKLIDVAGIDSLDNRVLSFNFIDKNGVRKEGELHLKETDKSVFRIDFDNSGTYEENEELDLLDADGKAVIASEATYQQLMDVVALALSGVTPGEKISDANYAIDEAITVIQNSSSTSADIEAAIDKATHGYDTETREYIKDAITYGAVATDTSSTYTLAEKTEAANKYNKAMQNAELSQYGNLFQTARHNIDVHLDHQGKMQIIDKTTTETNIQFSLNDYNYASKSDGSFAFSFVANDAIKIEDPAVSFYDDLDQIIESVRKGEFNLDANNNNSRSLGINYSLNKINHLMDHVQKAQTTIGSYSNALQSAQERAELLSINVQTVRSGVIDVDLAEAYLKFQQVSTSYQATLSTVSKINSLSLLNYM